MFYCYGFNYLPQTLKTDTVNIRKKIDWQPG